jgi:hypothetical protein
MASGGDGGGRRDPVVGIPVGHAGREQQAVAVRGGIAVRVDDLPGRIDAQRLQVALPHHVVVGREVGIEEHVARADGAPRHRDAPEAGRRLDEDVVDRVGEGGGERARVVRVVVRAAAVVRGLLEQHVVMFEANRVGDDVLVAVHARARLHVRVSEVVGDVVEPVGLVFDTFCNVPVDAVVAPRDRMGDAVCGVRRGRIALVHVHVCVADLVQKAPLGLVGRDADGSPVVVAVVVRTTIRQEEDEVLAAGEVHGGVAIARRGTGARACVGELRAEGLHRIFPAPFGETAAGRMLVVAPGRARGRDGRVAVAGEALVREVVTDVEERLGVTGAVRSLI